MIQITGVLPHSPADAAGICCGDALVAINDTVIHDVLDYRFAIANRSLTVALERNGAPLYCTVRKQEYDDLGLEFASALMDEKKVCGNHCVFCFIDQNPAGMRASIYLKDDDARLSFLQGSYITLTNLTDADVDRIIAMHLPMHVSVHTTDPALRAKMLGNRTAGDALRHLYRMAAANVTLDCQIVLCPGWNDGAALHRTLADLFSLLPAVDSIAVVPLGLTKHRQQLCKLTAFTKASAAAAIDQIEAVQAWSLKENGSRIVYAADELYLLAERPLPAADAYEGYPQYENGVGMLRALMDEFADALAEAAPAAIRRELTIATGTAAAPFLQQMMHDLHDKFPNVQCHVRAIVNRFYGESVTVAGLLTGQDVLEQLTGQPLGEVVLLSETCLRHDDVFLDDMTRTDLMERLGVPVYATPVDGARLLEAVLGMTLGGNFKE